MKRGKLTIKTSDRGSTSVHLELVDDNVWMTKSEITYMFNVFTSAVISNLNTIFKSKELFENEVTLRHKDVTYYNLDVIIALSFRLNGGYCKLFRAWIRNNIQESISKTNKQTILIDIGKLHSIGSEYPIS